MADETTEAKQTGCLYLGLIGLGLAGALAVCGNAAKNHAFYESPNKQIQTQKDATDKSQGIETILDIE